MSASKVNVRFLVCRAWLLFALSGFLFLQAKAGTFPLQIPKRPTSFPLARPDRVGDVVTWGSNTWGQVSAPPNLTNIVAIAAGYYHSLALRNDGTVVAWGDNRQLQCNVPNGLTDVVAIAGGGFHSIALKNNGRIVAWGRSGAIGSPNITTAVAVSGTDSGAYALLMNGSVISWGSNYDPAPQAWTNAVAIAGLSQTSILTEDGFVVRAGENLPSPSNPGTFGIAGFAALSTGLYQPYAIRTDGAIVPTPAPVGLKAVGFAAAENAYAAILGDASLQVWGTKRILVENVPPRLRGVIAITAGFDHFVALKVPSTPIPTTAVASARIVEGFIVGLNVVDGGEGYPQAPKVTISGGGGSGATAVAQISRGVVTGFTMTSAGIGYTSQPTITIEGPPILPTVDIATSRVMVTMRVVPGRRYQLESSDDLPNFGPVGTPFVADEDTVQQEFLVTQTGQFFRLQELP